MFIEDNGDMIPRSKTGVCAKRQRQLSRLIKQARIMALLPYFNRWVFDKPLDPLEAIEENAREPCDQAILASTESTIPGDFSGFTPTAVSDDAWTQDPIYDDPSVVHVTLPEDTISDMLKDRQSDDDTSDIK